MNEKIWEASKRNSFPYNFDVWATCIVPMVLALVFLIFHLTILKENSQHLKTILLTIFTSVFAYWLTDKLIYAFKDNLCEKGQFGRDLNKSGIQRFKKPV